MQDGYSRNDLISFLDYMAEKGLMNRSTAASRKASSGRILSILTEDEAEDLRKIDTESVFKRFTNIEGKKYSPQSLTVYYGRFKNSIDDFFRYKENPLGFKSNVSTQSIKVVSNDKKKDSPTSSTAGQLSAEQQPRHASFASMIPESSTIMPIPLRENLIVRIHGLPFDLTKSEAKKIANVVMALASEE